MTSDYDPATFDDSILVTIDPGDELPESEPRGLEFYERCVEKKLASDGDAARVATVRQTMQRLMARSSAPEQNREDYDLIVRYLAHGRLD